MPATGDHIVPLLLCLAGVVTLSGCDDGRPALYPVKGTVAFSSGGPVRNATIEFVPDAAGKTSAGPSPRGRINAQGQFALGTYKANDGAPAGDYQVIVVQALPPGAVAGIRNLGEEHKAHSGTIRVVALKHASAETSHIACTVKPLSENEIAIEVDPR